MVNLLSSKPSMSGGGWKDIVKNGWHPEKDGSSLKDQVKGLVGRGEKSAAREDYVAPPISSLRDPSSFAPPPKHRAAYGPTSAHAPVSRTASPSSSISYTSTQSPPVGAPGVTSQAYVPAQPYHGQQAQDDEDLPPPEPKPYRVDTTGLSTAHLPPPPGRRDGADGRPPRPPTAHSLTPAPTPKPMVPPTLPPRLPPRSGDSTPNLSVHEIGQGQLNQGAIDRLGAVGISVPDLGIGAGRTTQSPASAPALSQVDELQAHFARMGGPSPERTNSSSTTSEEFRPRVAAKSPSVLGKKKPPPPPPKKPTLLGARQGEQTPPPIPLATRPTFK
ncbi:hypothetical protein F5Y17DRAFT_446502 [Xylariaceae sp. FL0594]|nr:hypothetical protein F5Y17DRAFT_446502 [Xylariaceae sp. FL0594]